MESNVLQFLTSKSLPSTIPIYTDPSAIKTTALQTQIFIPPRSHRRSIRLNSSNGIDGNEEVPQPAPTITPPETVEIRFRRRSKKRNKQQRAEGVSGVQAAKTQTPNPPKKWEDMSFAEKALELYMGEKGMLFWLNKFAYASIFIVIGGWILFRFVGPSLNLYQLDTSPLPPSAMFKGS